MFFNKKRTVYMIRDSLMATLPSKSVGIQNTMQSVKNSAIYSNTEL